MTASRTCRSCGADLSPDVMWCLRSYEPVRHLTPRAPQLPPLPTVHEPKPEPRMSRWHAGPTTFGPVGRVVATLVLALFAPWHGLTGFGGMEGPLMLWYLLGYTAVAAMLLRHIWRKERVVDPNVPMTEGIRSRVARRAPRLGQPIPPLLILATLGLIALATLVVLWVSLDTVGRYYLVAVGAAAGTGLFLVVWNEL